MRSNYKKIGTCIRKVNVRNAGLTATTLLGINIDKFFMPSVANIVGTDMSAYKIVKRRQFSCNRMHVGRDYRLPISMSTSEEEFLVSPAYDVFEVKNEEELLPEYLMMWFLRKEFDRNSWFYTDADVRGGLHWDAFCDMELPIPLLGKQREIVKEYNVVKDRIELNNKLIQKLEETAQAIYRQWFVDFEFPDEDGKPYKSSGGEMVKSELGEIPKGWSVDGLNKIKESTLGGDWGKDEISYNYNTKVFCIRGADIPNSSRGKKDNLPIRFILNKNLKSRRLVEKDIVIEISGGSPTQSTGRTAFITNDFMNYVGDNIICSNFCRVLKAKKHYSEFFYGSINYLYNKDVLFSYENSSNGVKNLALDDLFNEEKMVIPELQIAKLYSEIFLLLMKSNNLIGRELEVLEELKSILLSKLATVTN